MWHIMKLYISRLGLDFKLISLIWSPCIMKMSMWPNCNFSKEWNICIEFHCGWLMVVIKYIDYKLIYPTTLANLTLIILFSKMLKNSKWKKWKKILNILFYEMKISKLIKYLIDICQNFQSKLHYERLLLITLSKI